jgi:hypothetical protein
MATLPEPESPETPAGSQPLVDKDETLSISPSSNVKLPSFKQHSTEQRMREALKDIKVRKATEEAEKVSPTKHLAS